jgi:opacity protein-like surface antigen
MRKAIGIAFISLLFSAAIQGVETRAAAGKKSDPSMMLLRAGYFMPAQAAFRDIYGGGPVFGVVLRFGRKRLNLWVEGSYFAKSGKLSETAEATDAKIMALEAGALWAFRPGKMTPYIGAGAGYYQYKETNVIGEAKQGKPGFCGVAGAILTLSRRLLLDARLKYNTCSMQPADFKINIGGLVVGVGLGLRI